MRKRALTILLFIFSLFIFAQQKKIDSLNNLLKNHKENDTIRLNILNGLANYYESVDAETGLHVSDKAIELASILGYKEQLAKAYINKAYNYIAVGKDSFALKLFYKSIDIYTSKNHIYGNASALYGIARVYQNWSDYDKAIEYYNRAYLLFESMKNKAHMAKMRNGIAICYMYSSNYPKALENYIDALHYYETEKDTMSLGYGGVLSNIGIIYSRMEQKLNLSLEYLEKSLKVYEFNNYKIGIGNTLSNMANTYDNLNQPLKAIELQKQSYEIYKTIGNKLGMANALTNIGIAYTSVPDFNKCIYYLEQTLPIYKELGNKNNLGIVEYYLGEVLLEMPLSISNLSKAENHLKQAFKISKETGNIQTQADANNALSKLYTIKGDYKKAFEFKELAIVLHDSITSQDLKDEITRLEVKYEYDKKEADIIAEHDKKQALAQAEIKRQKLIKNGSIFGGSILFFMTIFGLIVYKRKRDAVSQKQEAEFKTIVANTELKALRSQMNPHFIFNSLNSINDFIQKNETKSASNYLTKFAKIMRQTLENSTQKEITLHEDLKLLELYMQIEAIRLNNKFTYKILVDNNLDIENTLVPPLILQPFIENSIWHGISKKEGLGHISINIKKENNMIVCVVEDDGVGIKQTQLNNNKLSLGQSITKSRIDIINKVKNTNGTVNIIDKSDGKGVIVEVKLPLELVF